MSAPSLEVALARLGIACSVEGHDRLAVLVPRGAIDALGDRGVRRAALQLARDHGFTHIALELTDDRPPVPGGERDASAALPHGATVHRD